MARPLLLAHSVVCNGPWTPTRDLEGVITAKGLSPGEDEIIIRIRDLIEECAPEVKIVLQQDAEVNLGPISRSLIQANHTKSSGQEIFVWVA